MDAARGRVETWFARNTWRHEDFSAEELAAVAATTGTTISVVVPALDEAATVGDVVDAIRRPLLEDVALVSEIVVVDGGSSDATARVARAAGARVVHQHDVLAHAGPGRGKGDALWKGVAATTGDLVVFLDADLHDADPRYVVGLVGPLLTTPTIGFVKACYDRPLRLGDELRPAGGGRVTELTARPLLAAFWPELGGVAQPLSGEYAGRRALLESVPFVEGYGVELGLLIDVLDSAGLDAIGQVDLGRRLHDHQPLSALGRMAAEILHVAAARLASEGRLNGDVGAALRQPTRRATGELTLDVGDIDVSERPPLVTLSR